jgi:hypothetical protein
LDNFLYGVGRLDGINIYFFLISSMFFISTFFILFYYRNEQPLKSRRFIPFFGVLAQYIYVVLGYFENTLSNEWRTHNHCMLNIFIFERLANLLISLPFFILFRYIILVNLNHLKQYVYKKSQSTVEMTKSVTLFLRLFSFLNLETSFFIFIFFIYFSTLSSEFLLLGISKFNCIQLGKSYLIIFGLVCTLLVFFVFLLLMIDVLLNIRVICSKWGLIKYFIRDDIYYFRLEYLSICFVSILFSLSAVINFSGLVRAAYASLIYYFFLFFQVWLPLLITIFRYTFRKKELVEKGRIENIFEPRYDEIYALFEKFASKEFSVENLYIKKDIKKYKAAVLNKAQLAKFIFSTYLNGKSSLFEVNIENKYCHEIYQKIQKNDFSVNLFDSVESEIDRNMADTFSRFRFEKEYLLALKSLEFSNKEIERI